MLARALKEVRMPFPDNFFPRVEVSSELQAAYRRTASELLQETLHAEAAPLGEVHPSQHPKQWKFVGERSGLQLYRQRGVDRGSAVQVVVIGLLHGVLDDVMWGLYAPSHSAHKTQRSLMHKDYLDAALLHVLDEDPVVEGDPGFAFRFAGLKWLASAPAGKLLHKRDVCWYEELGLARDASGNDIGFLAMHSVRVPECPPLEQQSIRRSSVSVAYVFRDLGDGRTSVYMTGSHAVGGNSRSWSSDAVMVEMWLAMANKVAASKGAEQCKVCGKNVCDRCRLTKLIYPTRYDAAFPNSFAFCKRCLLDAKDQLYAKAPPRLSFQSDGSSSRSHRSSASPRLRSGTNGVHSAYSSSSSMDSHSGSGGGPGQRHPRDRYFQQPRQPHYHEVSVKRFSQASPRSSTSTAVSVGATTGSESSSSFSDPVGSSYFRSTSSSSPQSLLTRAQHALSGSSFSSPGSSAPRLLRDVSTCSAPSLMSSGSKPRGMSSQRTAAGSGDSGEYDNRSSEASSSSLSDSDDSDDDDEETATPEHPSPTSEVLARLQQIEMFADDDTGLVQLPPSHPIPSKLQLSAAVTSIPEPSASAPIREDRIGAITTYQATRNGGLGMRAASAAQPDNYAGFESAEAYGGASSSAMMREREQLRQRLEQMSRDAEATYIMATKIGKIGMPNYNT
ncbi:hypothetical protein PybrP1_004954 [[Pythium] brassicae (nom. inval.)]|nr:hypothetical protein PybrP1_004954 [[Pythium] brassicae (nom. inval.)]